MHLTKVNLNVINENKEPEIIRLSNAVVIGISGSGKTVLLNTLYERLVKSYPNRPVRYITSHATEATVGQYYVNGVHQVVQILSQFEDAIINANLNMIDSPVLIIDGYDLVTSSGEDELIAKARSILQNLCILGVNVILSAQELKTEEVPIPESYIEITTCKTGAFNYWLSLCENPTAETRRYRNVVLPAN